MTLVINLLLTVTNSTKVEFGSVSKVVKKNSKVEFGSVSFFSSQLDSSQNLYCKTRFCMCVCFNSSETATSTSIKLGTIDHHPVVSVTRGFVTS